MTRFKFMLLSAACLLFAQACTQSTFEKYFEDKSLRIDYMSMGDAQSQTAVVHELREEPVWGGPKKNLIEPFGYGEYLLEIYDHEEYEKAYKWTMDNCPMGFDVNEEPLPAEHQEENWEFCVKMTLVLKDILLGNPVLADMNWLEESRGRNGIVGGFQGQRQ